MKDEKIKYNNFPSERKLKKGKIPVKQANKN